MKARASDALVLPGAEKAYLAIVCGVMENASGVIDMPIKRLNEGDMLRVVSPDGQRAVTHYEALKTAQIQGHTISLLRLRLETGRTHQIRVHCRAVGHPVLGDGLYGTEESRAVSEALGVASQALHARRLTFTEPLSGAPLDVTAPLPEVFTRFFDI
jgi:23S rRNA pseudouridine1911/1915/1917 synthase